MVVGVVRGQGADPAAAFLDGLLGPERRKTGWMRAEAAVADESLAFFSTWCPAGTSIEMLVAVESKRWAIEDTFESAKTELGLAHNKTRS